MKARQETDPEPQDLERPFAQVVLVWSIGAPLAMAYLWLQVLSLARFNKQIFEWALTTRDNDVYRALQQNQEGMTFSVFGFTITLQRIRVTVISFVVGVLLKFVTQMVMDAAKETEISVRWFRVQLFIILMFGLGAFNARSLFPFGLVGWPTFVRKVKRRRKQVHSGATQQEQLTQLAPRSSSTAARATVVSAGCQITHGLPVV